MAQIRWSDIESRPWFAPLSPEEKIGVLDRWTQDQLGGLGSDEEKLVFEASSDALKQSYLGNPMPQDMNKYVQDYALKKAQAKVQQEAERDLPFVSLTDTASSLWDAVRGLPPTLKASYYQLKESSVRPDQRSEDYKRAMLERDAYLDELERVEADQQTDVGNAIRGAAGSLAFTGVGMGAAITGGALGRAVGTPVGAAIGGAIAGAPTAGAGIAPGAVAGAAIGGQIGQYAGSLGASALAAYNLAYEDFRYEAFKQAEQNKGAPLSEEEADALDKQIAPLAENTAAWEAGPEALGNVVTLGGAKLIYGLTKDAFTDIGKRTLGRLAKAGAIQAGSTGLELTTEAITQYNQAYDQAKLAALLQGKPLEEAVKPYEGISGLVEAGKEVAPTVLALQGLLGGGAALAGRLTAKKPTELTEEAFRQTLDQQRAAATLLRNAQEMATGEEAPSIFKRVDAFNRLKMLDKAADTLAGGDVEGAAGMLGVKIVTPQQAAVTAATPPPAQTQTPPPVGNTPAQTALPAVVANTAQVAAENNAPLTATTLVNTSADLADAAKRASPTIEFPAAVAPAVVETPTLAPTPTTDATLQGQVPENRVEERQDVDAGGPAAEAGGGNRPVQGGQEQAQEENVTALLQNLRQSVTAGGRKDWSPAEYAAAQQFFATGDEATLATLSDVQASRVKSVAKRGVTAAPAPVVTPEVPIAQATAAPRTPPARKPAKKLGRNAFGTYDLLDFLQENTIVIPKASARKGAGEYDWLEKGDLTSLRPFITTYTEEEAANVDTLAQQAYDYKLPDGTPAPLIAGPYADDLIEGIRSTWAARQQSRAAGVASGQGVAPGAEKIRKDFEKAIYGKTGTLVDFEDIRVGDKLTIGGQEMTVVDMAFPDETATVPETIFVDGPFFGRQFISTESPVRVDSIEKAERPPVDEFAPEMEQVPTESLPAGQPTSGDVGTAPALMLESATEEQLAQEAKQAEDRQRIAEGQARRLTGTAGEMGTPDMLDVTAGETPLFSQPAPAPAVEAAPAPAVEAAPAPAAEAAPAPAAEAAPAPVSEKIGKVRAKREDLFAKFRKKSGQVSMGVDAELAAIAAEIAVTYVEEGVIRFSDFASRVKADAADLWGQIRSYLHGAWTSSGTFNPNIDEVNRAEAAKILDDLDAAPTPVEEAAPQKEELPTDLVDEDSVPTPPPAGEPATPEERNAKLGFGQNKRRSVNQILARGEQNYLFETLLDDTQMAAALRSNSDAVRRAQGVVRRMPEYQDYLAEKAKTPQQREQENAPFVERVTQGIEALNNVVGASAEIAADGSVRIKTLPEAYKPLLSQNGFVFDATEQAFINRNYAKVLDFQQALRDALTGQTTTNQNRTPDGIYRARVRAEQESETNQSTLPAEAVATSLGARIKNLFMRSGMPDIVQAEQMHDVALMTKAQQEGKPMFLLASGTGTGKTFVLAGFIAEMRRLGVQGRIVFVTQSKDLADQNKKDMAPYLESTGSLQQLLDNTPAEQRQEAVDSWLRRNPDAAKALQEAVNAAAEPNIEDFALEEAQDRFAQAGRLFQVVDGNIAFFRRVSGRLRPSGGVAIRGELGGIPAPAWDFLKPIVLDDEGQIIPLSERFNSPVEQDAPYADLMTVPEDNSVEFISYSDIDNAEKFKPSESDILIFDESHKVRYDGNDVASKRALKAAEWIKKSKFTVFSSATPFESIQQMRFLWPTKVFDLLPGNRPYGDVDGNWYNFVAAAGGVVSLSRDGKPTSSEFKADDPNEEANMLFARDFFYKKGMMAQRVQRIPVEMTENDFLEVEGEAKWADLANKIVQVASSLKGLDRNTKGYITHLLKRVLEYSKINAASDLAMREAALGRQVAIFVETRSEKLRNLPELVAIWDAHKRTGEPLPADFTPRMSGAIDLFRGLIGMGVTSIDFPDIQTMFRERLGDNVVFYTGAETGKSGDNSLGRWTNKEVPVLVSTVGRGGTGLSLHDRSENGSAPRTQIVLTLPWRATETDQVAGRVVRYGMTSKAKLRWLFANNILNEEKLAAKVGSRMRSMSTLVTGAPSESSERISNWQFDPLESVFSASKEAPVLPVSTDAASAEAVEEVQLEVSSQPAASAKPSDRVVGNVSMESMQAGLASLARLFPGIRNLVRIDTAANLLADPNISDAEKDKIRQGAQGLYYKGRVLIAQDNVRQTVFHKDQTVAASVVIFHELMHKGADIIKSAPQLRSLYARWESMLSENVSETELDNLVRQGYAEYSNWREDRDKKLRAQEEVFVRKLESLLARKGVGEFAQDPGLVRRFLDWMRDLLDTLFGLSPKESFPDAVLRDWGREFIRAANLSGYYRYIKDSNVAASVASFEGGIELPVGNGTPRTGLETLTLEQAEAFKEYSKQNDSNLKLSQILGFGEQGNVSQRESLAPLSAAAQDLIGFAEDESGFPIVSESATDNARRIALQLLDPATEFGEQYQRQFGPESAATAVLQLELVRYGQALLQKGDYSLLGVVKTNANSVVLGTYLTATAAGRVLRARGYYVSDVQQTIEEYNDLAKEALLNSLTKEGASRDEAESVVEAVEKAIREAELSQQQLLDLAKNLNSRPEAEAVNSAEDVLSRIERGLELFGQPDVAKVYGDLTTALLELAQEEQDAAEFRAASAAAPDVSASFFTDPRKAGREKPKTAEEAAERVRAAREKADALAKKLMGLLGKKKKPTTATAGEPRKTKKTESEAQLEDAEEDVNEATEAARRILEELDAFLKRKFQTKAPQKTIYDVLRKLVDDRIANAEDLGYAEFVARLNKELEGNDIDPKVVEDLVARSWTVYQRHPGKTAQSISAKFQRLLDGWTPYRKAIPQRTEALRDLVQQAVQNKDNLELGEFMDRLVPQLEALTIPTDLANRMAEDVFNEFGRRQEEKATNRFNAIRTALLNGARDLLIEKASVGDPSDALWRMDTLRSALEESGLSDEEIDNALPRFTQSDLDIIFGTTPPAQVTPQLLNARIERVRQRYEESLKRPKEEPANVVRQDNIRRLLRRQLRVPAGQEAFRAQAAMFGATREQADRLFELTERERSLYIAEEGRSPTLLSKLVGYIRSAPAAIRNSPENRKLAIEEFLEQNGFDKVQIRAAMPWISREFDKFIQEAKKKALEAEAKRIEDNLKRSEVRRTVTQTEKLRELINKDLQLIRDGLGDFEADPTQALAKTLEFTEFKKEDYRILSDLDLTITRALQDGRAHDMARGLKELYDFMGRRKAPKTFFQQLAVSYNNSALSGVGTLAINIVAPGGALAVRAALDVFKHLSRGNLKGASDVVKILTDSMTNIVREVEFSLVGGANLNAMQSMIGRATNLQPELRDNLKKYRDKDLSPQARLFAGFRVLMAYTDITRRLLGTTDHVWYTVMQNYFLKTQGLKELTNAGVPREKAMAMLFYRSLEVSAALQNELLTIANFESDINEASDEELMPKIREFLESPYADGSTEEQKIFEDDFKAAIRRTAVAFGKFPRANRKNLLTEIKLQKSAATLRANDKSKKELKADIVGLMDPTKQAEVQANLDAAEVKETEFEMGTHRGEESPMYDIANVLSTMIQKAGSSILNTRPILGRMLLGYFGIPINLLNRSLWFTPYGLLRYAIAKNAMKTPEARQKFYTQSMNSQAQIRQRFVEASVGTAASIALVALQLLGEDDDEFLEITLGGPVNKAEYDAWYKMGNRRNSIQLNIGGKVFALNYGRGPLESLKIALILSGAVNDMRLNRKIGDDATQVSLSEYLAAVLSGWNQQASFFGAKSTIGATLSASPDASVVGTLLYKLNPVIPFSGLIASTEKFITGPNQFRGRQGAIFMNLPIARSLLTERAVNPLGDAVGTTLQNPFQQTLERLWYAGMPMTMTTPVSGEDARIYQFILDRGIAPGLPQRAALESKNGLMWDSDWQRYVEVRGQFLKTDLARNLARFQRMSDDDLTKAIAELSTRATKQAKRYFRYQ